jgi:hypothetical protein
MTQYKNRKAAVRARMAETGEPYSEAARHFDEESATPSPSFADVATQHFGVPEGVLSLAQRHHADARQYPYFGQDTTDCLKIWLDIKDWVALAKAHLGRPESEHDQAAYEALRWATATRQATVLLTATTYMELDRVPTLRQRTDLANVIAEISGFASITGRSIAAGHQLRTVLAERFGGPVPEPIRPYGLGVSFAFGDPRRLVLKAKDGRPVRKAKLREIETGGRVLAEYMMVRGPAPEDLPGLHALGYRPEATREVENDRVNRERELAAMIEDGTTDRSRLSDIVHARYLFWELRDQLRSGLEDYGIDITEFFDHGKEWLTGFLDDIPGAAVTMTLIDKNLRNSDKSWTGNDLRDADAMSAAIPYCDVVLTDKHVAAQIAKSPAVAKQGAVVLARLRDLSEKLPELIASNTTTARNKPAPPLPAISLPSAQGTLSLSAVRD